MNLILLGAPGAGKGTQAELLTAKLSIPAISTGNMLREAIANGTPLGQKVKKIMDEGCLVPDDIVLDIVAERVSRPDCQNGFILDGVPRTLAQAEALEARGIHIDHVISIEIDDAVIEARMTGRRVCSSCGASYHIEYKKPAKDGVCNSCDSELIIRKDDKPEVVLDRLNVYHEQTEPLKDYYAKAGKLVIVEGQEEVKDTTALTLKALED